MKEHLALRTPVQRGRAGWNAILGDLPPPRLLEENETADFVVIGAGFAGLAAARRLTQLASGARIAILEAGRIAEGAAGRNSGFMIDLPHNLPGSEEMAARGERELISLNRQAQDFTEAAVREYGIDPNFFDRTGKINGAGDSAGHAANEREKAHLDAIDEPSEMLDSGQMTEVTGSEYYRSGLYTPGTVMLQPAGFIRGMAAGLVRTGIHVFEESPATGFARQNSSWIVYTPKAAVQAGKVILAVNGHLESFGFARARLMHLFLFGAMTPELSPDQLRRTGGQDRWGITPADHMGATGPAHRPGPGRQPDSHPCHCGASLGHGSKDIRSCPRGPWHADAIRCAVSIPCRHVVRACLGRACMPEPQWCRGHARD